MKYIFLTLIWLYQKLISPILQLFGIKKANNCRFYPTCSEYSKQAFQKHGFFKGFSLSIHRIYKCHPWGESGIDEVPK